MPFDEALERFSGVAPADLPAAPKRAKEPPSGKRKLGALKGNPETS